MICGGHGTALIASGPIGWLIGAIIGLVVAGLTIGYGAERARQMAETWHVPGSMRRLVLSDRKIAEVREKLFNDLAGAVEKSLVPMRTALVGQVTVQVEKEIEALSEINEL
jgi:molecular chaperone DnaK